MKIDTAVGPVEASELVVEKTTQEIPCGNLSTTSYLLNGVVVKRDQHVDVSELAMAAAGLADM